MTLSPRNIVYRKVLESQLLMHFRWLKPTRASIWDSLFRARYTVNAVSAFQGVAARWTAPPTREQLEAATPLACIQCAERDISNMLGELFL
jgi:hypothetical protein